MRQQSKLLSNISYNFLSQFWFFVLTLTTTPYIVHKLGTTAYGVLSLVSVVMGYFAVLDFGLGAATIKYIADYYSQRDFHSISKVVGTSLVIYSAIGGLGTALIAGAADLLARRIINVPQDMIEITRLVFYISSIGFLVNMPLTVFNSIPNALQRFDILVKRNLVLGTTNLIGQIILLSLGFSLKEIVILNVSLSILGIAVFVVASRRLLPQVSFKPTFDLATMKHLMRFSAFKALSIFSGQIVFQADRLLIGIFLPITSVTYYVVPLNLTQRMLSLIPNITNAVFPAVSEYRDKKDEQKQLYLRAAKSVLILLLPVALVLFALAEKILGFWMGPDFAAQSTRALQVLTVGFLLASFSAVPCVFAEGLGRPELPALFASISAVLNVGFALVFIPRFGIVGAAMALIANAALQVPVFINTINRRLIGVGAAEFVKYSYAKPILAAGVLLPFYLITARYVENLIQLGLLILSGSSLYMLLCFTLGCIEPAEWVKLKQYYKALGRGFTRE